MRKNILFNLIRKFYLEKIKQVLCRIENRTTDKIKSYFSVRLKPKTFYTISCAIFFTISSLPLYADELIVEPDAGTAPILQAIENSQQSLDVVMYGFTDKSILQAIIREKSQHRQVKVLLEQSPYHAENENTAVISLLEKNHIDWQGKITPFRLIHQKTLIIDGQKAMIMTFNFTHSSLKNERNFALIIDDPARVKEIANVFNNDWEQHPLREHSSSLIYSPDDSREKLLSLINHTTSSIDIYAQNVSDYELVGALANAARRHVTVRLLTSNPIRKKTANYLKRAHVQIKYDNHYYIHAKVFVFDNKLAVIGSINLTASSLDDNRELSVVTTNKQVITQLNSQFANDWQDMTLRKLFSL